jgi:hypothetical protein
MSETVPFCSLLISSKILHNYQGKERKIWYEYYGEINLKISIATFNKF